MTQQGILQPIKTALLLLGVILLLFSCNKKVVYSDYKALKGSKWNQDSVLRFDLTVPDSTILYNLFLNVRNEGRYPYSNLWVFVKITPPKGPVLNDTIEMALASPEGKWFGHGLGGLYDLKYPYKQTTIFHSAGYYRFEVRQGMRTEDGILTGIRDFGITLDRVN
jgi:gliding motility-associated lipoprotein GldH